LDASKKTIAATERDEAARAAWWARIAALDPARLVFVDETGSHRGLTPRYARAPRGERAPGRAPACRGKNLTLVGALGHTGIVAALTLEGALDGVACAAFAQQVLAPRLRPGQVVIWDNVKPHQDATARAAVEARGCDLVFLPAYSPDLSPIELAFSKVKEALRRAEARTREDLETAIGAALAAVTPDDAAGWFRHCGYFPQPQLT
jgi:transposase